MASICHSERSEVSLVPLPVVNCGMIKAGKSTPSAPQMVATPPHSPRKMASRRIMNMAEDAVFYPGFFQEPGKVLGFLAGIGDSATRQQVAKPARSELCSKAQPQQLPAVDFFVFIRIKLASRAEPAAVPQIAQPSRK